MARRNDLATGVLGVHDRRTTAPAPPTPPAGAHHFLHKRAGVRNRADGAKLDPADRYTDCSFVTRGTAGLGLT
ncbi:hypothetical protein [Streptomyces venezuelae]